MKAVRKYDDTELLKAIENERSTNEAILYLYEQYAEQVGSFIIGKGGTRQDGQDVFQEAVVALISIVREGKFRGDSSLKTFLMSVAKNIWYNEMRKRQSAENREKIFEGEKENVEADISSYIGGREARHQFRELLGKLGENCQKILLLFYYENISMKEMVKHLPYENEQVVRNKKYKCLQQLTELVKSNPRLKEQLNDQSLT